MKPINTFIFSVLFLTTFIVSCESTKSTQNVSQNMIEKIRLEKVTMGSNSSLEITKDEITNESTIRGGAGDASKGTTQTKDWNKINNLVSKLDLTKIDQWEGPTQARFYDGAKATVIVIESAGQTYNSQSFDEGEPPAELKELYNYLESLENQ